jgi:Spy/CpxP family protein refolding chaperone
MSRIPVVAKLCVFALGVLLVSDVCYAQGRRGGGFGITKQALVGAEQVQTELKLTDAQKNQISDFIESSRGQRGGGQDLSQEERAARRAAQQKEADTKLAAILNADQVKRLDEIYLQVRRASALSDEAIATKLGLTAEQKTKIGDILTAERETLQGARGDFSGFQGLSDDERRARLAEMQKKTDEINAATEKAALAVLTDAQKTQYTEMKGKAFALDRSQFGFGGRRRGGNN